MSTVCPLHSHTSLSKCLHSTLLILIHHLGNVYSMPSSFSYITCCLPRPGPSSSRSRFPLSRQLNARIDLTGFRHSSSGDKSVECLLQVNKCLISCGETPDVQMFRCRLVLRKPYACSPEIDGSVLIIHHLDNVCSLPSSLSCIS